MEEINRPLFNIILRSVQTTKEIVLALSKLATTTKKRLYLILSKVAQ